MLSEGFGTAAFGYLEQTAVAEPAEDGYGEHQSPDNLADQRLAAMCDPESENQGATHPSPEQKQANCDRPVRGQVS